MSRGRSLSDYAALIRPTCFRFWFGLWSGVASYCVRDLGAYRGPGCSDPARIVVQLRFATRSVRQAADVQRDLPH